ncbi:NAD(P)-dependent oxidoreductase [Nitrososphaera sp.]|uniref:NAD-dependent epimerase/dehydratase family protein n=1 Tax=Nitrososphaera sp. TaxID=1971748 RepID=UPI003171F354
MPTILVTGGEGTIGTPLVDSLTKQGNRVFVCGPFHSYKDNYFRCDVSEYRQLERLFDKIGPVDYVYHLAAEFGRNNGEDYYEQLWNTNVVGTKHMIRLQEKLDFKMIFASSSEIYGELPEGVPYKEDTPFKYSLRHYNDYAMSKWVNEQQIRNSIEQNGTKTMILRFFNAYGPGEYYHPYRSVVCLFIYKALTKQKLTVYQGYHRVFQYIDDFIATLGTCYKHFKSNEIYNVGGREYNSTEELADKIIKLLNLNRSIVDLVPKEKANVVNKRPDISKAERDLGHNPATTLDVGLPKTIEWMKKVYGF